VKIFGAGCSATSAQNETLSTHHFFPILRRISPSASSHISRKDSGLSRVRAEGGDRFADHAIGRGGAQGVCLRRIADEPFDDRVCCRARVGVKDLQALGLAFFGERWLRAIEDDNHTFGPSRPGSAAFAGQEQIARRVAAGGLSVQRALAPAKR